MFKIGDTVRLKSGGPLMTVTAVGKDDTKEQMVWTFWFVNSKVDKGLYPVVCEEYIFKRALVLTSGRSPSG
jgi:uncharacterized protein YodC (DUF2158 family)